MADTLTPAVVATTHAAPYVPWFEKIDLPQAVATAAIMVIAWFLIRTIRQIDINQRVTADALATLTKDFYTLLGEHNAFNISRGDKK